MLISEVRDQLRAAGVRLRRGEDGRLYARPARAITPQLAELIRSHKPWLLAVLIILGDDQVEESA